MAGPRRLPDGRPAPDTAPDEDILDRQDLRGIADALREGKKVGLSSDGKIHVFDDPEGPPIDAASEAFVEDHLGEVRSMLQMGFNATIHPSGEITANSHDGRFMYQTDEVVALTAADRDGMRRMIAGGADVGITPDGSIQYSQNPGLPVRTLREADAIMAMLDGEITSGRMAEQAAAGRGFTISGHTHHGDGVQGRYVEAHDIPGVRLPDPVEVEPPAPAEPVPAEPAPPVPDPATPRLTDAEEGERLERYADDLDERARLVHQAAEAAARGDEARANELLDQSRIELVEEPPDLVGDLPAVAPDPTPAPVGVPARPGEFDGPIGAVEGTADGTEVAATSIDPVVADDLTGAGASFEADPAIDATFAEPEPEPAVAEEPATDFAGTGTDEVAVVEEIGAEALDA